MGVENSGVVDKVSSRCDGFFRGTLQALQPDTNNLVILMVGAIVVYALYMLGKDATRMADTALGGLLGFLGSSMKKGV